MNSQFFDPETLLNDLLVALQKTPDTLREQIEQGTEQLGAFVTPIAEHPLMQFSTKMPGLQWLLAALGQVNSEKVEREVMALRGQYPLETQAQLAQRVIVETAIKAGGIGLMTNFIPPLALTLLMADLTATTALQAEMIYRIAAIYGFSVHEPSRRGEVLALFFLASGSANLIKSGLSLFELIPILGVVIGITSNASLIYSIGHGACYFYETKKRRSPTTSSMHGGNPRCHQI
ncbi:EcsC family protein [Synechocystis sp. FACHB-383]|uniref:EcsC family protein n=1 Tax=Synechocystis sp. FACHB-383 TaxID=2692864 RepID=UPI0016839AAC|nr:EcsC family protein [Synechocystis sp. FACHB-383]MBD2655438.1 EcsC family protein [Synechocystis sp. FACHB-383]